MKAIIKKAISRTAVIIKGIFTSRPKQQGIKMQSGITRLKPHELYTNKIFSVLKGNLNFPVPPLHRSELKMVHRRLVQYQRLRWQGSPQERAAALKKLEKEWSRFQRNHLRKIRGETGKIIPMSFGPKD
jgi:hypothetical protein